MATIAKKICLIGDFAVGKTSLIRQFVDQQFNDTYLSTVGVKISRKLVKLPEQNAKLQLMIWDMEGSTTFKTISPSHLQGAAGAILVGDVTRDETLESLMEHAHSFLQVNPRGKIVVALNKADRLQRSQLSQIAGQYNLDYIMQWRATYPTSAKSGTNIEQIFSQLSSSLLNEAKQKNFI